MTLVLEYLAAGFSGHFCSVGRIESAHVAHIDKYQPRSKLDISKLAVQQSPIVAQHQHRSVISTGGSRTVVRRTGEARLSLIEVEGGRNSCIPGRRFIAYLSFRGTTLLGLHATFAA
jgi:hypothetical protein